MKKILLSLIGVVLCNYIFAQDTIVFKTGTSISCKLSEFNNTSITFITDQKTFIVNKTFIQFYVFNKDKIFQNPPDSTFLTLSPEKKKQIEDKVIKLKSEYNNNTSSLNTHTDTIFLKTGDVIICKIKEVRESYIKYLRYNKKKREVNDFVELHNVVKFNKDWITSGVYKKSLAKETVKEPIKDILSTSAGNELIKASNSFFIGVGLCVVGSAVTYLGFSSYNSSVLKINNFYINAPPYTFTNKNNINKQNELKSAENKRNIIVGLGVAAGIMGIFFEFKAWYHIRLAGKKMNSNSNNTGLFIKPNPNGVSLVYKF